MLIVGAGPIGLLHLLAARVRDPEGIIVSEPSDARRAQAFEWGADRVIDPTREDLAEALEDGADVIIVAAPAADAQAEALKLARAGGRINFFGGLPKDRSEVPLDTNLIHYKELVVTGTTASTNEDCRAALDLVTTGAVDAKRIISTRRPLTEAAAAFDDARSGGALKVVIEAVSSRRPALGGGAWGAYPADGPQRNRRGRWALCSVHHPRTSTPSPPRLPTR